MVHYDFSGRAILVTGIGLATARAFGRSGADVVVAARGAEAGERALISLERSA